MQEITNPALQGSIIDTHAHYDDAKFDGCRDEILQYVHSNGVDKIINCAVDLPSCAAVTDLSEKFDFCYSAAGFHPENLPNGECNLNGLLPFLQNKKTVAVGEIGLDYYWNKDNIEQQRLWFEKQCLLANELRLPVIVHDREAHGDTLEILKKVKPSGVVHCFSGSAESAAEIIKLGMYIGIGGAATFKNAKKIAEVIMSVPLERILLETDAPYMAPEPYRGSVCNSAMIISVAEKISQIKKIDVTDVLSLTKNNSIKLFNL